ncbi:hypothetical protein SAMN05444673_6360 [Bacillus sp. OV166]|uniref:hypothetical protein n=1 Tax=Bacillus sp. OV166 TaxID=1882763 RepID=UPI000A2AB148|nr:hypothetical protein [Bacillus sp. OV166]SMQ85056.1 hypothetical protein SAMN05444673_6360 [Bacillus sp. OV166]
MVKRIAILLFFCFLIYNSIGLTSTSAETLGGITRWDFPSFWTWRDAPINIYTDGKSFLTNFDVATYKNAGGKNIYVDPVNGSSQYDGLSESKPVQSLLKAYLLSNDGDTIWLKDGIYKRSAMMGDRNIEKSINIIAVHPGKVHFIYGDDHIYTKTIGYNNIYQTSRTNVKKVIDIQNIDVNNETKELQRVNNLADCNTIPGSWFTDGSTVYVHTMNNSMPNNKSIAILLLGKSPIYVTSQTKNVNLYLEGFNIYGSSTGNVYFSNSSSFKEPNLYMKNMVLKYAYGGSADANALSVLGAKNVYVQNCEASYSIKDGFNYHGQNGTSPNVIEVNSIGYNNGDNSLRDNINVNNGSTIHDGGQIIRINGVYHDNMGANVADVHPGTKSLCLGCIADHSRSTVKDMTNSNFGTQQRDAEMWLENCVSYGSLYGITAYTGTTMHIKNTKYESKIGGGTFIFEK